MSHFLHRTIKFPDRDDMSSWEERYEFPDGTCSLPLRDDILSWAGRYIKAGDFTGKTIFLPRQDDILMKISPESVSKPSFLRGGARSCPYLIVLPENDLAREDQSARFPGEDDMCS